MDIQTSSFRTSKPHHFGHPNQLIYDINIYFFVYSKSAQIPRLKFLENPLEIHGQIPCLKDFFRNQAAGRARDFSNGNQQNQ